MAQSEERVWRELRGTDAGAILIAAERAGGVLTTREAIDALDGVEDWEAEQAMGLLRGLELTADEDYDEFRLSRVGRRIAQKVIKSQIDGPERWDVVQRAMLRFVASESPDQAGEIVGHVVEGQPVTPDEADMAAQYLLGHQLMTALSFDQGEGLQPKITAQGRYAIHEPNIREYVERGFVSVTNDYSTNTTVSGGTVGAVTGGTGNVTIVTITAAERTQLLTLVDKALGELPTIEDAALKSNMHELKAELSDPNASRAGLLARARDSLVQAAMTENGRTAIGWIGQIVRDLSGS